MHIRHAPLILVARNLDPLSLDPRNIDPLKMSRHVGCDCETIIYIVVFSTCIYVNRKYVFFALRNFAVIIMSIITLNSSIFKFVIWNDNGKRRGR